MTRISAILIDSGHGKSPWGWNDNGASGNLGDLKFTERDYVVDLGRRIYAVLREKLPAVDIFGVGIETRMSCSEKTKYINQVIAEHKYDPAQCIVISLHTNAGGGHGSEFWIPSHTTKATTSLAASLAATFTTYADFLPRNPAVKPSYQDRWGKLYIDDVPGVTWVLIESFFIDCPTDLQHALGNRDRLAEQISHAILEFVRN